MRSTRVLLVIKLVFVIGFSCEVGIAADSPAPRIITQDNRVPAGRMDAGALQIALEVRPGEWYPEADDGPHIRVYAFAETGKSPSIPGPLIRVPEGTQVHATVRNALAVPIVLHGFFTRPGADEPVTIDAGAEHLFDFATGAPGTYYYWAAPPGATLFRGVKQRLAEFTQLDGAIVIDPKGVPANDRIFVLGLWRDFHDRANLTDFFEFGTINGRSWPYTEHLKHAIGDVAHWRIINASAAIHPMHMHGSYFQVTSRGDNERDVELVPDERPKVVTEQLAPGATIETRWSPDRPGRWLFHCHLMGHLEPKASLSSIQHGENHSAMQHSGMVGLVLGIEVSGRPRIIKAAARPARKLTLDVLTARSNPLQVQLRLHDGNSMSESRDLLGPPIVLHRGEPVEITVANHLSEPTAIHWHGIELESYYDGVPGYSGSGKEITPPIPPGGSFIARMTPPRAGTFIYHTHWHDLEQLRGGLNGALLVIDDDRFDSANDKVFVTAFGPSDETPLLLNGSTNPAPVEWRSGQTYRIRFVNIGPNVPVQFTIRNASTPLTWRSIAKDGMTLPAAQQRESPSIQSVAVGETYDFQLPALAPGDYLLRGRIIPLPPLVKEANVELTIHVTGEVSRR